MKKWIMLFIVSFILFVGGYIIYPKPMYITYLNERYYGEPEAEVLTSQSGKKIEIIADETFNFTIVILNDDAVIKVNDRTNIYVFKDGITYDGNLEYNEEDVDARVLQYVKLAKQWNTHSVTMNEDYAILFYVPSALIILFAVLTLFNIKKKRTKYNERTLLFIIPLAAVIIAALGMFNLVLIIYHL